MDEKVKQLAQMIDEASYIVALTGAGCSAPSGIPCFRGSVQKMGSYTPISTEIVP